MAQPFIPAAMEKLLDLLNVAPQDRNFVNAERIEGLKAGIELPSPAPIFPRFVEPEEAKAS
jgi:methionyl-tRNA synthetase